MPPRARQFAIACALLLAIHAVAAGALWTNGAGPDPPDPRVADRDADAATLLAVAAHNDAAFATTSTVRMTDPGNGTTLATYRIETDPSAARIRATVLSGGAGTPLLAEDVYLNGWGRWTRRSGDWQYSSRPGSPYDLGDARLFRPAPGTASSIRKTVHENGSVTVRLRDARPAGLLWFAGENATLTYRLAFHEGQPYVAFASAAPADEDGVAITVDRRLGADVDRPDSLPPMTTLEMLDRLVAGARYT